MTNEEMIEQLEQAIGLIKQDGKDWLDDRDIPILEACIKSLTALDKIRAEIEQTTSRYSISRERGGMGQVEWSDNLIKESEVLKIIDKYKAESEG